jgi:diguanylate cyclase (GGDEF)-like protein
MEEFLERELKRAQRKQAGLGLIILDIDHFKDDNDTYGHECGDEVLREMGPLLQAKTRVGEIACRFGGEEFILILPETSLEITLQRAEQVRQAVSDLTVGYQQKALRPISVSVGVAAFPVHGMTAAALIAMADAALYQAKHHGRNRVEVAG